jgi:hypothetical protein
VIEPSELAKGSDALGPSGHVFIAFPYAGGEEGLARAQASLQGASGKTVFFAEDPHVPELRNGSDAVIDEFAGRDESDPVFSSVWAGVVLGVDDQSGEAFQLLVHDPILDTEPNLEVLDELGVSAQRFEE